MENSDKNISDNTILRPCDATRLLGLSRPTLYRYIRDGILPRPAKIGKRAVGWKFSVLRTYIESRS